jgi:hypothetical protein
MLDQTLVHDEADVLKRWLSQSNVYGAATKAGVFTADFKSCDAYLRKAETLLPTGTTRKRGEGSVAKWILPNDAVLILDRIPNSYHAYSHAGRDFTLVAFHDPADWADKSPQGYLLGLLRSATGVPLELMTVHTAMVHDTVNPPAGVPPDKPAIDYSAITRSVL